MPREVPTLNLGDVADLVSGGHDATNELFHAFGIFKKEVQAGNEFHFCLFDEYNEIEIRPAGNQSEYPRPKPGDIVRVHRLRVNKSLGLVEIIHARNVLIWPAFEHEPTPRCVARAPTVNEEDNTRRRILESYFCSRVMKLIDLSKSRRFELYDAVAGRVENMTIDLYGHFEIEIFDGTANMTLRVFRKMSGGHIEDDVHFKTASELKKGEYIVATTVKLASNQKLNLSANTFQGRSIRKVAKSSILGTKLAELIAENTVQSQSSTTSTDSQIQPRRSPRFLQQNQDDNRPQAATPMLNGTEREVTQNVDTSNRSLVDYPETLPNFTPYCSIKRKDQGYEFYNLVGQVRDKPRLTNDFGNCILQIFDGSLNEYPNYYASEVDHPLEGCLIVCIYSKQKGVDTNEHLEKARSLNEGELIYLTNVRVSFVGGRIRVELSANKSHNKSITVIDKQSAFGRKILNMAETPQVAELREVIDPSSEHCFDSDDDF